MDSKQKDEGKSSSVDIKARNENFEAPTPNNTPIFVAPIQSSKAPKVAKVSEEEDADGQDLLSLLQSKFGALDLPAPVKRRIYALENIQEKHTELEAKLRDEILALEKKYHALHQPLYNKRADIISGRVEPTDEEAFRPDATEAKIEEIVEGEEKKPEEDIKGIPEFWLSALKNQDLIASQITEADDAALKYLVDIRFSYLDDNPGFRLEFEFAPNEFFTNTVLTKTYYLTNTTESGYDETLYDHADGCEIKWNTDKNLTVKVETKKQRNKTTKKIRTIKKFVPTASFFNFFSPPKVPEEKKDDEDEDEEEVTEDIEEKLHTDYEIGDLIKSKIIPHAVNWFTGKALQFEDDEDYQDDDYMDDDYEEQDDEDGDDDDDEDGDDDGENPSKAKKEECKQQ